MKAGKIVAWTFAALLLSGMLFAFSRADAIQEGLRGFSFGSLRNLGPGETVTVDQTEVIRADAFKRIEIHTDSPDLTVRLVPGNEASVRLVGAVRTPSPKSVPKLVMEEKGDTLVFRLVREPGILGYSGGNLALNADLPEGWHGGLHLQGASSGIRLAAGVFASLEARSASGDLSLGTLKAAGSFTLETTSGKIDLKEASCHDGFIRTTSGNMRIGLVDAAGKLEMEATSGEMDLEEAKAGTITMITHSGDVRAGVLEADSIRFNGTSAEIEARSLSGLVEASTSSGDVSLIVSHPGESISVGTTSGRVQIKVPAGTGLDVDAGSSSGSIGGSLSIDGGKKTERAWTGFSGDKSVKIRVSTVSGDIGLEVLK